MRRDDWLRAVKERAAAESEALFWLKVDRGGGPGACWPWTGRRDKFGYGQLTRAGHSMRAHTFALRLRGLAPVEKPFALHTCDVPYCCNADHLYWGTKKDNAADRERRGRSGASRRCGAGNGLHRHPEAILRGESHGSAKLTSADVARIRAEGIRPCDVVKAFRISPSQAKRIVRGESWRHLTGAAS